MPDNNVLSVSIPSFFVDYSSGPVSWSSGPNAACVGVDIAFVSGIETNVLVVIVVVVVGVAVDVRVSIPTTPPLLFLATLVRGVNVELSVFQFYFHFREREFSIGSHEFLSQKVWNAPELAHGVSNVNVCDASKLQVTCYIETRIEWSVRRVRHANRYRHWRWYRVRVRNARVHPLRVVKGRRLNDLTVGSIEVLPRWWRVVEAHLGR